MSTDDEVLAWVAIAEVDFHEARNVLRRKNASTYLICYHAQQGAEKYLKALLILQGREFPKTHDLRRLFELCDSVGVFVPVNIDLLDKLTSYAVRVRYPGDEPIPEEAKEAVAIVKAVRAFARKFLGLGK